MKTKPKTKNRLLTLLGAVACGTSSFFYTGCQAPQIRYLANPEKASRLTIESGKTANYLDAKVPRTKTESLDRLRKDLRGAPTDIAKTVDNIIVTPTGFRPFKGTFGGKQTYKGLVNYETEPYVGGSKKLLQGVVIYGPRRVADILEGVGGLTRRAFNIVKELANMTVIQPLTYDTKAKQQLLETGKLPETTLPGDRTRLTKDTATDVVKAPLRMLLAVSDSKVLPPTVEHVWNGVKRWGGIDVTSEKSKKLELKLINSKNGKLDSGRMFVNAIPIVGPVLDGFNGTTLEKTGNGFRKVAEPIKESIPALGLNDNDWYPCPGLEAQMPGTTDGGRFYPTESWLSRAFGAIRAATSLVSQGGGASFGGGRIGGSGGGGRSSGGGR